MYWWGQTRPHGTVMVMTPWCMCTEPAQCGRATQLLFPELASVTPFKHDPGWCYQQVEKLDVALRGPQGTWSLPHLKIQGGCLSPTMEGTVLVWWVDFPGIL